VYFQVDLPPMDIWSRLESTADNLQARLPLQVLTKGWLFDTVTDAIWRKCVLSPKGYLVIYVKEEKLRGYALDITLAKKIRIEGPTPKYAAKKGFTGTEKVG
jgi:hypothetical protein